MAIKTIRVFAEYTSDGYVPMPSQGNIDYGVTVGSTFPETQPSSFQTDDPNIDVAVTTMTDFYVWIRTHGSAWNPNYTRVVRVYPDSPSINSVVMNMIVAVGGGGTTISSGGGVNYYLNGGTSQGILDGSTYYEMNKVPVQGSGVDFFKINTTGFQNIAQFVTDAGDPGLLNIPAGNWPLGFYMSASDNSGAPKFYAEIYKYSAAGVFTLLGSSVATPEVISNGQAIDYYTSTVAIPDTTLLVTDRIAIRIFVNTDGNRTINLHTQDSHLSTVGTTFTRGLTAINGLIKQVQFLAIGNAGSDAAIVSSDDTHTINLPTASATKRGLLNSTDWSTFNAKQPALSGNGFVKISGSTISYDNSSYQPLDGDLTAIGALAGTSGILKKTGANTWELDTSVYLSTASAASTYQRLDKMVSNLLPSDTEYPNSNAVLAKLALKADAANPSFTGSMNISGAESRVNFYDENAARKYFIGYDGGFLRIYQDAGSTSRFYINSSGKTFIPGTLEVGTIIKTGGLATEFLKADGTVDSNTYALNSALANYLLSATAGTTYQTLANLSTDLTASTTKYPSVTAVNNGLATKQPLDADLTAIAALTGTSGLLKKTAADTWTLDTAAYITSSALTNYLLSADATTTYQRKDKMVSNLLASDTEYPNSNAVIAALALKANAANPTFTGDFTISGVTPRLYFVDTDNNPDYTLFTDSGYFYIYDQTAGATRFSINSSGYATFNKRVTFQSTVDERPQLPGGFLGIDTGDSNFDIWGISRDYYPSNATAANAWGIRWNGTNNDIEFVGAGVNRAIIDLDNGNITANSFIGNLTGNISGYSTYATRLQTGNNQWTWSTGAHTATNPNSITLWDQYGSLGGAGNPVTYGTLLDIYGRDAHEHDQLLFDSDGVIRHRNCFYGTNTWNSWKVMLNSSNYSSYALPLSGGTLYGTLALSVGTYAIKTQSDGASAAWRGIMGSYNATADIATFIGNYNSKSGIFGHNNAMNAWNTLRINTLGVNGMGKVILSNNTVINADTSDTEYALIHAGNVSTYAVVNRSYTNWASGNLVIDNVVGLLAWKNYGNNHVIFDASNSTSPTGSSINATNSQIAWTSSYPTLMGWNGSNTYGVRVDNARYADSAGSLTNGNISQFTNNSGYIKINDQSYFGINNTDSTSGNGISLYGSYGGGPMNYGIMFAGTPTFGTHGAITSDWSTYFMMNNDTTRGWIFRRNGGGNVASISGGGILTTSSYINSGGSVFATGAFSSNAVSSSSPNATSRIVSPSGAAFSSDGSTGAIRIKLPFRANDNMWTMRVRIYNYATNQTCEYLLGNYSYAEGGYNSSATFMGGSSSTPRYVRFGNQDGVDCVWIGETNTGWDYPVVTVTDFTAGFRNTNYINHSSGWNITIVNSFGSVGQTLFPNVKLGDVYTSFVDSQNGFKSTSNPWNTANSAYFPNGITTAGSDNWIYGHTYIGNAPSNGNGHEFWANGTAYSTGVYEFGLNSGNNNGIGIRYGSNGYGRVRFYQDGSNHSTIHAFGQSWIGGVSAGYINIDGQNGVNFGGWDNADVAIPRNGVTQFFRTTYAYSSGNTASAAGSGFQCFTPSGSGTGAIMSFHRAGVYAVNFGLDSDNVMRIGGWSAGANRWQLDMSGNQTLAGSSTATAFYESSDSRLKDLLQDDVQVKNIESLKAKLYIKNGKKEYGYFAQEAQTYMPSAVTINEDGYLNLSYREVHTVKIARLEREVEQLKKQLNVA